MTKHKLITGLFTILGIPYYERKSKLNVPEDAELVENEEGPFTTNRLVLNSTKIDPKCLMCGSKGSIFVFDGPAEATVFCNSKCQAEYEHHGRIGSDSHDIVLLDTTRLMWLSFGLLISGLAACWYMQPLLSVIGSSFSKVLEKLLFAH